MNSRTGHPFSGNAIAVRDLQFAWSDHEPLTLDMPAFSLPQRERCFLLGASGSGKSTLLKIVMEKTEADLGEATWGYEATPGYFPQDHHEVLNDPKQDVTSFQTCRGRCP